MLKPGQLFKFTVFALGIPGLLINLAETVGSPSKAAGILAVGSFVVFFLILYILYEIILSSHRPQTETSPKSDELPSGLQFAILSLIFLLVGMTLVVKFLGPEKIVASDLPPGMKEILDPYRKELAEKITTPPTPKSQPVVAPKKALPPPPLSAPAPRPAPPAVTQTLAKPSLALTVHGNDDLASTVSTRVQEILDERVRSGFFAPPKEKDRIQVVFSIQSTIINPVGPKFIIKGAGRFVNAEGQTVDCPYNWGRFPNYEVSSVKLADEISKETQHLIKEGKARCSAK